MQVRYIRKNIFDNLRLFCRQEQKKNDLNLIALTF